MGTTFSILAAFFIWFVIAPIVGYLLLILLLRAMNPPVLYHKDTDELLCRTWRGYWWLKIRGKL